MPPPSVPEPWILTVPSCQGPTSGGSTLTLFAYAWKENVTVDVLELPAEPARASASAAAPTGRVSLRTGLIVARAYRTAASPSSAFTSA